MSENTQQTPDGSRHLSPPRQGLSSSMSTETSGGLSGSKSILSHGQDLTVSGLEPSKTSTPVPSDQPYPSPEHKAYSLSRTGIDWHRDPTFDEWQELGFVLHEMEWSLRFLWGDWILKGEAVFGEMYAQALDDSGYKYPTLANAVSVCRAIPKPLRNPAVPFSTHARLAPIARKDVKKANEWLGVTEQFSLSGRQVGEMLKLTHEPQDGMKMLRIAQDAQVIVDEYELSPPVVETPQAASGLALRCPECDHRGDYATFLGESQKDG